MVLVCGGTHMARLPHTLWRPWAIGSSLEATTPSRVSSIGVLPGSWRERAMNEPAGPIVEERRIVDPQSRPDNRVVLVTGGADRVEAAVRLLQLARRHVELA